MKIHLTVDQPCMNGYIWASPENKELKCEFYNCWEFCVEGQCTDLYAPSILDAFKTSDLEKLMPMWVHTVRAGGRITLGGTDFYILSKEGLNRSKDIGVINEILFNRDYQLRSLTSIESLRGFFNKCNCKINNIILDNDNFKYTIEAIKNA